MPTTSTLTYYGDTGHHYFDGFAGFRVGQPYALTYSQEGDEVVIELPHAPAQTTRMNAADFAKCFRKSA